MTAPIRRSHFLRLLPVRATAALAVFAAVLAGCTPTPSSSPPVSSTPPAPATGNVTPPQADTTPQAPEIPNQPAAQTDDRPTAIETVYIKDSAFSPATMAIQVGTVVLFTNQDSTPYTVVGPGWELGPFSNGESWAHTFNKVGEEEIHGRERPEMTMKVTITEKQ